MIMFTADVVLNVFNGNDVEEIPFMYNEKIDADFETINFEFSRLLFENMSIAQNVPNSCFISLD